MGADDRQFPGEGAGFLHRNGGWSRPPRGRRAARAQALRQPASGRTRCFIFPGPFLAERLLFQQPQSEQSFEIDSGRMRMTLAAVVRRIVATLSAHGHERDRARRRGERLSHFPRAEYVFGCLKANSETRQAIEQCSCSIDVVASLIPLTAMSPPNCAQHGAGPRQSRQPVPHLRTGLQRAQRSPPRPGGSRSEVFLRRARDLPRPALCGEGG